jgi:uncharacterized protein
MPYQTGAAAISRGFRSLTPGGQLQLSFFGGEPLIEAQRIQTWMNLARTLANESGKRMRFNLTSNGTRTGPEAWSVMMQEDLDLAISFDGTRALHDRHRRDAHGNGSADMVLQTIERLLTEQRELEVITVVRPDNVEQIPDALRYMYSLGIRQVHLSLDLWTKWTSADGLCLQRCIEEAAQLWRSWLPAFSLNWFDAKVAELARLSVTQQCTRCGFGDGEIAVAPSGRLYPCERLIGEDRPDQPMRLPGHALEGDDFLHHAADPLVRSSPCSECALAFACDTICRCSNFIRTGDVHRSDGLLCLLNKAAAVAAINVLKGDLLKNDYDQFSPKEKCYA